MTLRVAFHVRPDCETHPGGDTVQILSTKKAIERNHGLSVTLVRSAEELEAGGFKICHLFGLDDRDRTAAALATCRRSNLVSVVSPIFADITTPLAANALSLALGVTAFRRMPVKWAAWGLQALALVTGRPGFFTRSYRRGHLARVLREAAVLLPNSPEELDAMARITGLDREKLVEKSVIVPNGVDAAFGASEAPDPAFDRFGLEPGYILQVGRLEPLKNQGGLLTALRDRSEFRIVFVGDDLNWPRYAAKLRLAGRRRGGVTFVGAARHELMPSFFRHAALHVMPSLSETVGLVSLEALACGCRAVASQSGYCPFESHFREFATAIDPLDPADLRRGILEELARDRDPTATSALVRERYSWDLAAERTLEAYRTAAAA